MGLTPLDSPYANVFTLAQEFPDINLRGDTVAYVARYTNPLIGASYWDGDAIFEDLTGDGRPDVLVSGNTREVGALPLPEVVLFRDPPTWSRSAVPLPALYASRFALRGSVLALAGRASSGLTLEVHSITRAATPTFTRLAQLPGVEFPALALGDCDADGDHDLFAAGADANGLPVATLYRNDAGTFTAATTLPGLFRGDAAFGDVDGDGDADLAYTGVRYGPGLAEGNVLAYRMQGCVPTPIVVPVQLRNMIGEFLAFEDVTGDGRVDIAVSGFDEPFRDRLVYLRLAAGDGAGSFTYIERSERQTYGTGSGTLLGLPGNGSRPSFLGMGIGNANIPGVWFYSRPSDVN
ncbi:MAG TPA: FG-GAP-like repeat-containing protein [Rhodothermales bacterium]|nr:FG-GAP-like repeat-containing protein [Rhodothermales bacterium]